MVPFAMAGFNASANAVKVASHVGSSPFPRTYTPLSGMGANDGIPALLNSFANSPIEMKYL